MRHDQSQTTDANAPLTLKTALELCPLVAVLRWIAPGEVEEVTDVLWAPHRHAAC